MKTILTIVIGLLLGYELIVHFVHVIYEINPDDARHRVNRKIVKLLNASSDKQPIVNIFFSSAEWQDLGNILSKHFYSICLYDYRDNNDGTLSVRYSTGGINTKYHGNLNIIKQVITIDTHNWLLNMVGYEVPIHVRSVSDTGLHLVFAYNRKGFQKLQQISSIRKLNTTPRVQQKLRLPFYFQNSANSSTLTLGIDYELWHEYAQISSIDIDLRKVPHLLITGATGTGKSYALKFYIQQILAKHNLYELWFVDFKSSNDFCYLDITNGVRYASGDSVVDVILDYYNMFWNAKEGIACPSKSQILVIDEYPALITHLLLTDKKKAEQIKGIIADILMLGRDINGLSFNLILTSQRPDASLLFSHGSRDNFGTWIAFGNLSSEAKGMITDSPSELPKYIFKLGEGIVKTVGEPIRSIVIPEVTNLDSACAVPPPEGTPSHP